MPVATQAHRQRLRSASSFSIRRTSGCAGLRGRSRSATRPSACCCRWSARRQAGQKEELFSSVWDGTIVSEAALTSAVKELRRASRRHQTPRFIESVYGRGYRFIAEVSEARIAPQCLIRRAPDARRERSPEPRAASAGLGDAALLYIPATTTRPCAERTRIWTLVLREEILFALSRFGTSGSSRTSRPAPRRRRELWRAGL